MSTLNHTKAPDHASTIAWNILLLSTIAGLMTGLGFPSLSWLIIRTKECLLQPLEAWRALLLSLIAMLIATAAMPNTSMLCIGATEVLRQTVMVHQLLVYSAIMPLHNMH